MTKKLIPFLLFVCSLHAATIPLNTGMSTATIQSTINGSALGDTLSFAAGTYHLTAPLTIKCGRTYTGPVVPMQQNHNYIATAILDGSGAGTSPDNTGIFSLYPNSDLSSPCTTSQPTTIEYLNFSGGYNGIYARTSQTNLNILNNQFTNLPGGRAGDNPPSVTQSAAMEFQSGTTTSNTASALHNTVIDSNQIGDGNSCVSPISVMTFTGSPETYEGACIGMLYYTSIFNLTVTNNTFLHVAEGVHINCPNYAHQQFPCEPPGGALTQNIVVEFNDFSNIHRINWEQQAQQNSGEIWEYNTTHDFLVPYFGTYGLSMACCYNGTSPPNMIASNNVVIFNVGAGSSGRYGYGMEAMGKNAIYDHELLQAAPSSSNAPGMAWGCGNVTSMSNNTVQGNFGGYIVQEGSFPCGTVTTPTLSGNVTGPTVTRFTSAAPTISPTPTGTYSTTIAVTITDTGFSSSTPLPQGNTSIFYTIDGSTPTVSSTRCTSPCVIPGGVAPGTTVNAIGMWGTGANLMTYPAGFGFVPSAVQGAHYNAGSAPTLTGVTLSLTGGGSSLQVGNSVQVIATCSYTGSISNNCTSAGTDPLGTVANTWTSSNGTAASINSSGTAAGLAAGSTNLTAKAGSFTSPAFSLTVVAAAPVLTGLSVLCSSTIAQGQTTPCTATCNYTGPQQLNCTTTDANGNVASGWASSAPTIATVSGNVVTGVAVGNTLITASAGGFTSNGAPIAVTSSGPPAATLTGVTVGCNPTSVNVGSTSQCTATCTYSDSTTTNCSTTDAHGTLAGSWTSTVTADATINSVTGVLTGILAGSTNVSATAGAFTAPALSVPVTGSPNATVLGNNQFNTVATTTANFINATYAVTGANAGGYTAGSCSFYLPTGTTYAAGSKWDCGVILAPTSTTQSSSWLCRVTYTTLGTSADNGWHTLGMNTCGNLPAHTGYWIAVNTNETSPAHPGQGFWNCGSSCSGTAPTAGNGTYPCYYISATYGVYTGMSTTMTRGCGAAGVQAAQYVTLNTPIPTLVGATISPAGQAASLVVGGSFQFSAVCNYSDGSSFVCSSGPSPYGDSVTAWSSSAPAIMSIGAVGSAQPGLATGLIPGFSNAQATITGGRLSTQWGVTINPAPPMFTPSSSKVFSR